MPPRGRLFTPAAAPRRRAGLFGPRPTLPQTPATAAQALTAPPPGAPNGRHAWYILGGELLAELRAIRNTHTRGMARVAGLIVNDVLEVGSWTFDTTGQYQVQYHVTAGSVAVDNLGTHTIWVAAESNQTSVPPAGRGVTPIPAGAQRVVNVASRVITFYGTTGDLFAFQVFTGGGRLASGALGAVDGGGV